MEFDISDLLDDFQDDSVQLQCSTDASAGRIKELTMKKIQKQPEKPRRGLGTLGRIILVAAIILTLATTVMAVGGIRFTDWVTWHPEKTYDDDVLWGHGSTCWTLGKMTISLGAEKAAPTGAVLVCDDLSGPNSGELTVASEYWLEAWDGEAYAAMEAVSNWTEEIRELPQNEETNWSVDWEEHYGALSDGFYRIGMTITADGTEYTCYAKFRIYQDEMAQQIEKCGNALEELLSRESFHATFTYDHSSAQQHTRIVSEVWKSGEDFLEQRQYLDDTAEPAAVVSANGSMIRDGVAYGLDWAKDCADSEVTDWEILLYDGAYDLIYWTYLLEPDDATTGEVYMEGNEITLLQSTGCAGVAAKEITYTFDDGGSLLGITYSYLPTRDCEESEKELWYTLEVHETSAAECEAVIAAQNVSVPDSFSWEADQAANPEGTREGFVNTEPCIITGLLDAIDIALADCTMTQDETDTSGRYYHTIRVGYDTQAQVWRVEFLYPQNERNYQAVYLSADGITLMRTGPGK